MNGHKPPGYPPVRQITVFLLFISVVSFLVGCGRARVEESLSAEEQWAIAKAYFENEQYLDAADILDVFTLNFGGSTLIDSAQYLLAECHFVLKDYILAESEYLGMVSSYPQSPLVEAANVKIILCNAYLAPSYNLDQKFTERTEKTAQSFLEDFPTSEVSLYLAARHNVGEWVAGIFRSRDSATEHLDDIPLFKTKIVYPQRSSGLGTWFLRVITFGIYHPPKKPLTIPPSTEVRGAWVAQKALSDSRDRLAKKVFKAAELYYRQKKFPSAVIYCDRLSDLYADTPWANPSLRLKGNSLFAMRKFAEAIPVYQHYLNGLGASHDYEVESKLHKAQLMLPGTSVGISTETRP